MEPKMGKRMVSKGEYVLLQGRRVGLGLLGVSCYVTAVTCGFMIGLLAVALFLMLNQPCFFFPEEGDGFAFFVFFPLGLLGIMVFLIAGYVYRNWGLDMMERAADVDTCIPLTRANTADLPASDCLVRASSESMQAQQSVLLRAAAQGVEMPPEELVRASKGKSEDKGNY